MMRAVDTFCFDAGALAQVRATSKATTFKPARRAAAPRR